MNVRFYELRDWFAGQALNSILNEPGQITDDTYTRAAEMAYKFAGAMIKQKRKDKDNSESDPSALWWGYTTEFPTGKWWKPEDVLKILQQSKEKPPTSEGDP